MVVKACVRVEALWCERLWIAKCCLETRSFTMCIESIRCPYAKCLVSRAVASWQRKSLWICSVLLFFFDWRCGRWEKIVQMKTTGVQQVKWQSDRLSGRLAARRTQVVLRQRCKRFSVCKASTGRANDLLWQMFNISKKVAQFPCVATWGLAGFLNLFPICGNPL